MNTSSLALLSSLPINAFIRSAVPYIRPRSKHADIYSTLFPENNPSQVFQSTIRDLIFLCVDTGQFIVIDWDDGSEANPELGLAAMKPGLRIASWKTHARPGKDLTSIGRFIKVSEEYSSLLPQLTTVRNGLRSGHGRTWLNWSD